MRLFNSKNIKKPRNIIWPWVSSAIIFLIFPGGCATGKIVDNRYIDEQTGFQFTLPGGDWSNYADAWAHRKDFGQTTKWEEGKKIYIPQPADDSGPATVEELQLPNEHKETTIFEVPVGFINHANGMKILVATISKGNMTEYLRWGRQHTLEEPKGDILTGYFKLFQLTHPSAPPDPSIIGSEPHPNFGEVKRMRWATEEYTQVMYGAPLENEFVIFALRSGLGAPAEELNKGIQALEEMVRGASKAHMAPAAPAG